MIERLQVDIPENYNISVRENRRVDPKLFIDEIFGVHIRDRRVRKLPMSLSHVKFDAMNFRALAENYWRKTMKIVISRIFKFLSFPQSSLFIISETG